MAFLNESPALSCKLVSPLVLSVSRATDIPAFYPAWLMQRLRDGYCYWVNPFNCRQRQRVSFEKVKALVFWSKNPEPLLPYLDEIEAMGYKFYFQFTLNNYENEGLEKNLPALQKRIEIFNKLADRYVTIWRYDPLIFGGALTPQAHIERIKELMEQLENVGKLVFSFVDLYGRVERNFKKFDSRLRAATFEEMNTFAKELVNLRERIAPGLKLATCAEEPGSETSLDIEKNSCIDAALVNEICKCEVYRPLIRQNSLIDSLKTSNTPQWSDSPAASVNSSAAFTKAASYPKDKGQRKACLCAPARDIGSYRDHPCGHNCVYCYAGHARI